MLAQRSALRQGRRSVSIVLGLALAVSTLCATRGIIAGVQHTLKQRVVFARTGQLVVRTADDGGLGAPLDARFSAAPVLALAEQHGFAAAPRILSFASASFGERSRGTAVVAVDPAREPMVCPAFAADVSLGHNVTDGTAVLSPSLVAALGVSLGDELTLLAMDVDGTLSAETVRVGGVLGTAPRQSAEATVAFIPLVVAERLYRVSGVATEIALSERLATGFDAPAAARAAVQAGLVQAGLVPPLELVTWQQAAPFVADIVANQDEVFGFIAGVYALVAMFGVWALMVQAVDARRREIGTMLALGVRRRTLVRLFVFETAVVAGLGALCGVVLGAAVVAALAWRGLPIVLPGSDVPEIVRPVMQGVFVARFAVAAVGVAMLAAVIPALRASRLTPRQVLGGS